MAFKSLDPQDFVVSSDSITSTLWSNNLPTLTQFFTSSTQAAASSGDYYLKIYNTSSADQESQFEVVYADALGKGSELYNSIVPNNSPTKTMYGQYRSLILEDENASFTFGTDNNSLTSDNFWVISVDRTRYKQSLFPGSLNLTLSGSGGQEILQLTDDSKDILVNRFLGSSRYYQLISGSNGTAGSLAESGYVAGSGSYGLVFPDLGTIILNPHALSQSINLNPSRSINSPGLNNKSLFESINLGSSFTLNSQETVTSDYVFVRARNSEFNYSENPSFISGSTGEVIYEDFINQPQVYVTTIGMYNNSNELLAVAKLSRPLLKDFTKESLVRVKLDF
tara:strand:- start:3864 stop:4877 length:1014 start_codon:yes stop_codon:yes gene_type:complete